MCLDASFEVILGHIFCYEADRLGELIRKSV